MKRHLNRSPFWAAFGAAMLTAACVVCGWEATLAPGPLKGLGAAAVILLFIAALVGLVGALGDGFA